MNQSEIKVYPYRWIILAIYSLISVIIQIQWLTFASVSSAAQEFYNTSALRIDFLSMIYMLVFIVMSIPASYIIDTWGLRKGLVIGALLTGVFGTMKAWGGNSLFLVTVAQIGLAVAQPFILNAVTKVGAKWFPVEERATAAGLGTLAQYAGIIIALAVTPMLIPETGDGYNFVSMLWIYGVASVLAAVLILLFMREEPPTPPTSEEFTKRSTPITGLKDIFKINDMKLLLLLFFIGLGIFNAVSTCIDQICRNLTMDETGMVGGIMLLGGVLAYSLTRRLRELTAATKKVAAGQLGYQVEVRSHDEVGELARAFNQMSADLENSNQIRKQMTADIAHDLRSPLSVILGYTEALSDRKIEGSQEIYEVLYQEAEQLNHLIEDLRTLSLADAGELALNKQPVSPKELLVDAARAYQHQAELKKISLRVVTEDHLSKITVDPNRMTQVLSNLLSNALRYTPEGGEII